MNRTCEKPDVMRHTPRMRQSSCAGLALLLLSALASCRPDTVTQESTSSPETSSEFGKPWLHVSETSYDFGQIPHGEIATKVFTIRNDGPQRVRLNGIRNQCTCAELFKRVLDKAGEEVKRPVYDPPILDKGSFLMCEVEPGETLELKVRVDTNLRPPIDHREPSFSELVFEPADVGQIRIEYSFAIRARLIFLSEVGLNGAPTVQIGNFGKDQKAYGVLELAPRDGKLFKIARIEGPDDALRLTPQKATVEGGHRWLVEVNSRGKAGPLFRELRFHTDLDDGYACSVQVHGLALPNLQIVPSPRIDYGRFDFKQARARSVDLVYRRPNFDPRFRVTKVWARAGEDDVSSMFKATIRTLEKGEWRLGLDYAGGIAPARRFDGQIELESADSDFQRVVVKFSGFHHASKNPKAGG